MDLQNTFSNLNWFAVVSAALSTFMIGGIWYSIFEKPWLKSNNITKESLRQRKMPLVFGLSLILSFLMALNLALFIGKGDVEMGAFAGFMAGFGWVALAICIISLFEHRPLKYVLINGGYMIVAFTLMGVIIGIWK